MAVGVIPEQSMPRQARFRRFMEINMEQDTLVRAALGRPIQLGMLYDCRKDSLVPGLTLWDPHVLEENIRENAQPNNFTVIKDKDRLEDKESSLDIGASLKASFLSGLVGVGVEGSAGFLFNRKSSNKKARVTMHYRTTTKFVELSMDHLAKQEVQHPEVFDTGVATHVVTGVLYGAHAFMVFEKDHESEESTAKSQMQMSAKIKHLASAEIHAKVNDNNQTSEENMHVMFHGDIKLDSIPTTFQQAKQTCRELPSRLGENGEKAVPMQVWLYPLQKLDSRARTLAYRITEDLIRRFQGIIEGLGDLEVKCDDLIDLGVCDKIPQIKEKFGSFKELITRYKQTCQLQFRDLLLAVRRGDREELELSDFLSHSENSPFALKQLDDWFVGAKEAEVDTTIEVLKNIDGVEILRSEAQFMGLLMNSQMKNVVCLILPIAEKEEFFQVLSRYLKSPTGPSAAKLSNPSKRFKDMVSTVRKFSVFYRDSKDFCKDNTAFAVAGFAYEGVAGSVMLYEGGTLKKKSFEPPEKPGKPVVKGKTIVWQPPKEHFLKVVNYQVRYLKPASTSGMEPELITTIDRRPADKTRVTIENLDSSSTYELQVVAFYSVGATMSKCTNGTTSSKVCSIL